MSATREEAAYHVRHGRGVVPIPVGGKAPRAPGWQSRKIGLADVPRYFSGESNIGVILGPASGELVDIDLDCTEALALADVYLPATCAEFGRASKPRSHRLYIAPGALYEAFGDPLLAGKNTLIELRAAGRDGGAHQTIFPPSLHPSGERVEWHGEMRAPAVVDAAELRCRVAWLAIGSLVARHVSERAARAPSHDLPALLWEAEPALGRAAYGWLGKPAPDARRCNVRPRRELSTEQLDLAELVTAIPNRGDWIEWNAIGLAIYAVDASDHGRVVFDDFSSKSPKYDPHSVAERWRNYRRSPPNRTGIGKLLSAALKAGWRPKGDEV